MKYTILTAVLSAVLVVGGIAVFGLFKPEVKDEKVAATGSIFHTEFEYIEPGNRQAATSTVTEIFSSTTPITFQANSTNTVSILTNGVADLRINLLASTTAQAPVISFVRRIEGSSVDTYLLEEGGETTLTFATTTDLLTDPSGTYKTSVLFTNINAPRMQIDIGTTELVDMSLEFVKIVPN